MKSFLILIIFTASTNLLFSQIRNYDGIIAHQIWTAGHTISKDGEKNFLSIYAENIKPLPDNIKSLLIRFSLSIQVDMSYRNQLAKAMGFSTFEEALKLTDKWIVDISKTKNHTGFSESMSIARLENKIYLFNDDSDINVLIFEQNKKGQIIFKEQYDSRAMDRTESPDAIKLRLKYEDSQAANEDVGIKINGLKWATRNVGTPNKFVMNPEDAGMHYQFNRKIGWNEYSKEPWNNRVPEGTTWEKANSPCPEGWRIPTGVEMRTLLDTSNVATEWVIQNGVSGIKFTDKRSKEYLFMPLAGVRAWENGRLHNSDGRYWSSEQSEPQDTDCNDSPACRNMHYLYMDTMGRVYLSRWSPHIGYSVRCISE